MYKLIVTNFDKTLIDDDLAIPITTVIAIDRIRRKNVKFAVATSREVSFVKFYIKDVNFIDYIIAMDGSYIYDVVKEKVIFEKSLKITDIKKIVNKYRKMPVKIYLYTDNSRCYLNDLKEDTKEIIIRDLNDFLKNNKVYKIEIHADDKLRKEIKKEIDDSDYTVSTNLHDYENKEFFVEITYKDISKYSGLTKVLKKEKIELEEVVAYGNNYNDMEVLSNAGETVAVSNAISAVKKICNKKTTSNNEKGIEKSLIKIFKMM